MRIFRSGIQIFAFLSVLVALGSAAQAAKPAACPTLFRAVEAAAPKSGFSFRSFHKRDTARVVPMLQNQFGYDPSPDFLAIPEHFKQLSENQKPGDEYLIVQNQAGEIVGGSGLYRASEYGYQGVWVDWFFVTPAARGGGIGKRMLSELVSRAQKISEPNLYLYTTSLPEEAAAQSLYEHEHFEVIETLNGGTPEHPFKIYIRRRILNPVESSRVPLSA